MVDNVDFMDDVDIEKIHLEGCVSTAWKGAFNLDCRIQAQTSPLFVVTCGGFRERFGRD
jgi:hypothetical protein